MFTYVKAKNFKSLKNVEFNLNRTKKITNDLAVIYGENGSGKTNVVELFKFLQHLTIARAFDVMWNKIPKEFYEIKEKMDDKMTTEMKAIWDLRLNIEDYRMIDEEDDTEVEYGFKIGEKEGYYNIKFNKEIVEESIYFYVKKQNGFYYKINKEGKTLNRSAFTNSKYNKELEEIIEKYWGKYSFLSLIYFELTDKNVEYVSSNIIDDLFNVLNEFITMTVHVNKWGASFLPDNFLKTSRLIDLKEGEVSRERVQEIKKCEDILNIFFTQAYADIKRVRYETKENSNTIKYRLFFDKIIGGKIKSIPVELESAGTKRIIDEFDYLIGVLHGETVIIDEIDNGTHDLLIKNIILSIKDEITGQLIITTHNTLLLEVLPRENIYILSSDYEGNKKICTVKDYGIRIQNHHNVRDLYLKGLFGGIPTTSYVDFEYIKSVMEDTKEKEDSANEDET